jgi:hypothetical protein
MSLVYNDKCLGEAPCKEFELTKIDKFIGVTWLLHKAYLKKDIEKYSMHAHQI